MVQTRAAAKSGKVEDTTAVVSPDKKRRVESSKKRHRGKRVELCQLNLDVLFLLAAYVHPLDLLNLARTCKSLRELLMDKVSAFIWKTARRQVEGLPDCPADLTEPEYANLVFYARCHGCGKHAKKILWTMRRRYCPGCRDGRLRSYSSCPDIIRQNYGVIPTEVLTIEGEKATWVDKEQMDLLLQEYDRSPDKEEFLRDKRVQHFAILQHACKCRYWEQGVASAHRFDLDLRRQERDDNIFKRLKQHGYEPEIEYFGYYAIKSPHMPFFKTSKPLTDKEWDWMWPEWLETMNSFRSQRLEKTVYQRRRDVLVSEYSNYVASPSPNTPASDLLPHVTQLSCFPLFRDIIRAPEGTEMDVKPFESAFAQLPVLITEWRKQIDAELAELVKIPSNLSFKGVVASSGATDMESSQPPTDKLRLACAVFHKGYCTTWYPEVFSSMHHHPGPIRGMKEWERAMPIGDLFNVKFLEDAPYIVHACGLDPYVATVEDVDHRNARLKCLYCNKPHIRGWRDALRHAIFCPQAGQTSRSKSSRWQIVSDEYMDAIQTAELSAKKELPLTSTRCLLCRPCVGDSRPRGDTVRHLVDCHGMEQNDIKQGVHYMPVGAYKACVVEMVEEGGQVTFRAPDAFVF